MVHSLLLMKAILRPVESSEMMMLMDQISIDLVLTRT